MQLMIKVLNTFHLIGGKKFGNERSEQQSIEKLNHEDYTTRLVNMTLNGGQPIANQQEDLEWHEPKEWLRNKKANETDKHTHTDTCVGLPYLPHKIIYLTCVHDETKTILFFLWCKKMEAWWRKRTTCFFQQYLDKAVFNKITKGWKFGFYIQWMHLHSGSFSTNVLLYVQHEIEILRTRTWISKFNLHTINNVKLTGQNCRNFELNVLRLQSKFLMTRETYHRKC